MGFEYCRPSSSLKNHADAWISSELEMTTSYHRTHRCLEKPAQLKPRSRPGTELVIPEDPNPRL